MAKFTTRGYFEMCNFPDDLIDERTECTSQNVDCATDSEDLSPRTRSFADRFELEQGEILVKTYTCALQKRIVLQGRIYVTSKRICFYSIFNKNTVFFGESTKLNIPYENILKIKKSRTMGIFKNAIEITVKTGKVIRFTSLLKRTKLYYIILELMRNYEEILDVSSKHQVYRNSDIVQHSKLLDNVDDYEKAYATSRCMEFDLSQDFENRYEEITRINENKLKEVDEEFLPKNLSAFKLVSEEVFEGVSLNTFYNKIYGDYKTESDKTFIHNCLERLENYNITDYPHSSDISDITFNDAMYQNHSSDEIESQYEDLRSSTYSIEYTHTLNEFMAPPSCEVREDFTSYFVSPVKVHILKRCYNSGFAYSDSFIPMSLITLEQIPSEGSKGVAVKQIIKNQVKFVKSVMFFEGKIRKKSFKRNGVKHK